LKITSGFEFFENSQNQRTSSGIWCFENSQNQRTSSGIIGFLKNFKEPAELGFS